MMLKGKRIKTLAAFINKNQSLAYSAEVVDGYCNTDRHIPGTRLRHPGKGRYGNKLIVRDRTGCIVFEHNTADTYRYNQEVVDWIERKLKEAT